MKTQTFKMTDYLRADEHFHFARVALDDRPPAFAHTHDYYEVFLVEHGEVRHQINGNVETLGKGALVFIRPSDCHALSALPGRRAQILNIIVTPATSAHLIARYKEDFNQRFFWSTDPLPDTRQIDGPRMERAINTAIELQTADRGLVRIEQFLLTLLTRVVDAAFDPTSSAPAWLAAACLAARDPAVFRRGATGLVEVSRRGHEHVCRTAQRHLGMSPTDYINRIRMEHAAMLLGEGRQSIEGVAADCGISNLSYFYRLFRQHYGTTPLAYKKRHASNPLAGSSL